MSDFVSYLKSLDVGQLTQYQALIKDLIVSKSANLSNPHIRSQNVNSFSDKREDINNYVDYFGDFVQGCEKQCEKSCGKRCEKSNLLDEVRSLKLGISSSPGKVSNAFLSFNDEPYVWESSHGLVSNEPLNYSLFPNIKALMDKVNDKFDCDLNTALVSHYKSGEAGIRLHDDNEPQLDADSPICVVSFGAIRRVEFVDKSTSDFRHTIKAVQPDDRSLYIMRPGCQKHFLHRVRKDKRVKKERFIISFRKFIPEKERHLAPNKSFSPVKNLIEKFDFATPIQTVSKPSDIITLNDNVPLTSTANKPEQPENASIGFSPFIRDDTFPSQSSNSSSNGKKFCVIFGTSITEKVNGPKLSRGTRNVINCSMSGAKIGDISGEIRDFCVENPSIVSSVDKIILCLGTNDIKYFNGNKYDVSKRFRSPLTRLVNLVKFLLPGAVIIIKCVLPMKPYYNYTANTVHAFNYLLLEICRKNGCIFFDCFSRFLDIYGFGVDDYLYRDKWHLNDAGLKVLCRALKFVIFKDIYNPIMRINCMEYTYLDW